MPAILRRTRGPGRGAGRLDVRPTLLQYAAIWIPALPVLAVALRFGRTTSAQRWVAVWCLVLVIRNAISMVLGLRGINNHWVFYSFMPLLGAVALWALSYWQPDATGRAALRYAIPLVVLVNVVLIFAFEDQQTFSLLASPFHFLVLLFAALWTFVRRSLVSDEMLLRQDWFWITGGIMLSAASATALGPLAWYFLRPRVDLLHVMLNFGAAADMVAFAAITWGMFCQSRPSFSGGSFSPPSSQSSSSSAGSASPW